MKKTRKSRLSKEGQLRSFVIQHLRRATMKWSPINEALKDAKVGPNRYKCASCENSFPVKEIRRDHIETVIPLGGFDSFDGVIRRMFCDKEGVQILCLICHNIKTDQESELREMYKKALEEEV